MQLPSKDIVEYIRLASPDSDDDALRTRVEAYEKKITSGDRNPAHTRVIFDAQKKLMAGIRLAHISANLWHLTRFVHRGERLPDDAVVLVGECLAEARAVGATEVGARFPSDQMTPALDAALQDAGFGRIGGRVEYKTPVEALPDETGSPLVWRGMDEIGREATAAVFGRAASGAPDWDEDEDDPFELLGVYLQSPGMTNDPSCAQVGYRDGEPVAFAIAQTESDGWGTITYMGVVPEARGQGLGKWVHRRGFSIMRRFGGTLYHGGTSTENTAMMRLFEKHGCVKAVELDDWKWRSSAE